MPQAIAADGRPPNPAPQQARSRATRRRLLEATVSCLEERGYAATTTTEVCRHAGVSQGALFKHFPTKAALLAATVEHLFAGLVDDYRAAFAESGGSDDPIPAAVRLLWETFERPALHAAFELMLAGRTDPELRGALAAVQREHAANILRAARELFPEAAAGNPLFEPALDTLLSAMQGSALGNLVEPHPDADAHKLAFLEGIARQAFTRSRS